MVPSKFFFRNINNFMLKQFNIEYQVWAWPRVRSISFPPPLETEIYTSSLCCFFFCGTDNYSGLICREFLGAASINRLKIQEVPI